MNISFEEFISRKGIVPQKISSYELAWKIDDIKPILQWLSANNKVVLGGDVLDVNKEYTYDNWFFENSNNLNNLEKITESAKKAKQYINCYYNNFGNEFYYVLVVEKAKT